MPAASTSAGWRMRANSHDFLIARWQTQPPTPPYLPDVSACELAFAKRVRVRRPTRGRAADQLEAPPQPGDAPLARRRSAALRATTSGRLRERLRPRSRPWHATRRLAIARGIVRRAADLRTRSGGLRSARPRSIDGSTIATCQARDDASCRSADSRGMAASCAVENLHHRQISAHPGRREHADLLDRACARRARA